MKKTALHPKVDAFMARAKNWLEEMERLRSVLLASGLAEDFKWGKPCYTFDGSNVAVIQGFKEYCAILFFKGMLLKDPNGILMKTGEHTRVGRQVRFTDVKQITKILPQLKACIREAIDIEKAGLKVGVQKEPVTNLPEEFKSRLSKNPALKTAFYKLTPGRQRGYNIYFSTAKQPATREARIEKCVKQILKGKGLGD